MWNVEQPRKGILTQKANCHTQKCGEIFKSLLLFASLDRAETKKPPGINWIYYEAPIMFPFQYKRPWHWIEIFV